MVDTLYEPITKFHGEPIPHRLLRPSQNHQVWDELLMKQREFAADIYFQKDLDRNLR